jgi:hypothetical protein
MKRLLSSLSLALAALALTATTAYASTISYSVSRTVGAGMVTGTIVTDGALGVLSQVDIVNWNLVINDGSNSFSLLGPTSGNNSQVLFLGTELTATATGLFFNYSGTSVVLFQSPTVGSGIDFWCLENGGCSGNANADAIRLTGGSVVGVHTGNQQIASAAATPVPEPATWTLIATGLAAFAGRRLARRG